MAVDHWVAEKFNWGDADLNWQAKSKQLGPVKPVWKSPSGEPCAGMLLKLAGKQLGSCRLVEHHQSTKRRKRIRTRKETQARYPAVSLQQQGFSTNKN